MRVLFAFLALAVTVSAQGLTGPNFYITGANSPDAYIFSINGAPVEDPSLNLTVATTYKFILNASMSIHPFGFSTNGDETVAPVIEDFSGSARGSVTTSGACTAAVPAQGGPNAWYTTSGSETTNPCIISFTPPTNITGLSVYYRCGIHSKMVGTLTAVAAAGGSGTTTGSGTGTGTGTGTPSGTGTPGTGTGTTPSSTGTGTVPGTGTGGKNNAAVIVPGAAAALIIAAINALFSA